MRRSSRSTQVETRQSPEPATITIGELAERAGVKPATLRMWEARHGFPQATRPEGGAGGGPRHRRYTEGDIALVRQVLRRQESGVRLEVAIAEIGLLQAALQEPPGAPSVYAAVRRTHPMLVPQRLKKSTLIALSWAIEDECCARAQQPMIFGSFQKERYFRAAEERWGELARIGRSATAFAAFTTSEASASGVALVNLPEDSPMRREWAVVCDAADYPAMLTAWELPGQSMVADRSRLFEAIWTLDPAVVRDAARLCAQVALQLGHHDGASMVEDLARNAPLPSIDLQRAASLLNRIVAYVDATG